MKDSMKLARILKPISEEIDRVHKNVELQLRQINADALPQFQRITEKSVNHLFGASGKYLRPSLVLFSAGALEVPDDTNGETFIKIATAVELIHSASLVHDDVIDEAEYRRDRRSLNSIFGNKIAVLVGDLLYAQFFSLLTSASDIGYEKQLRLFDLFCTTTKKMCLGEIYEERIIQSQKSIPFTTYLEVIDYKTASLMSACCKASAILAAAEEDDYNGITRFGHNIGMAYQLIDDVSDGDSVFSEHSVMIEKAVEYADAAKTSIEALKPNDFSRRLVTLADLIIRKARQRVIS